MTELDLIKRTLWGQLVGPDGLPYYGMPTTRELFSHYPAHLPAAQVDFKVLANTIIKDPWVLGWDLADGGNHLFSIKLDQRYKVVRKGDTYRAVIYIDWTYTHGPYIPDQKTDHSDPSTAQRQTIRKAHSDTTPRSLWARLGIQK